MKRIMILALLLGMVGCLHLNAQDGSRSINLDLSVNDSIIPGPGMGLVIYDDGGLSGNYSAGIDYHVTVESTCGTDTASELVLCIEVDNVTVDAGDTLYIYDGPTIASPLLVKFGANGYQSRSGSVFFTSRSNTSGMLTVRFKTRMTSEQRPSGFRLITGCRKPCEFILPVIDSTYEHVTMNGEVVARRKMQSFPNMFDSIFETHTETVYDTTWDDNHEHFVLGNPHDTTVRGDLIRVDTIGFVPGMTSCIGLGIRLHGHGEYTNSTGYYTPSDRTSNFIWNFNGVDSIWGTNLTTVTEDLLQETGCTDVFLNIIDEHGCENSVSVKVQIRVAQNPIKTMFSLNAICNNSYYPVTVGVNDNNSTLNLRLINFDQSYSKTYAVRTFIPDGPNCAHTPDSQCYRAPVEFKEFPTGRTVQSAGDICSVCINYEHSFMGDYRLALVCPTFDQNNPQAGGMAVLKYGKMGSGSTCDPLAPLPDPATGDPGSPDGTSAGSGTFTGLPLDSPFQPGSWDSGCDSLNNPYGVGYDYCWSRNRDYILVTGDPADLPTRHQQGNWYISSSGNTIAVTNPVMPPVPAGFRHAGTVPTASSVTTRRPSNHEDKTDYYSPSSDFSELIGCPLNGKWEVMVCDFWGADNGWVFSWSLDICGVATGSGSCNYQVGIDSVTWRPDTNYANDFRDGVYKGLQITDIDSSTAYITSPDTSGDFKIRLKIYDEFGCIWDTNTHITTIHQPQPNLGEDITICSADSIMLNGYDGYHGFNFNYSYMWEPYGQSTPQVYTKTNEYGTKRYIVQAKNSYTSPEGASLSCKGRDTINVTINEQPILRFDPGVYPLEGCEPFALNIANFTKYGYKYRWEFGDGVITTQKEPRHLYGAGQYTLKYYVESEKGCKDSLIFDSLVTVFPNPTASFSWEPEFPTVTRPEIHLINNSFPHTNASKYFWEIQYDRNHPNSYSTLREKDPTYRWTSKTGEDVTGNYTVRLISRTDNYGPSGRLVQCSDTVESTILIINDNIHFPSVVTPNGDGYNDRFVIQGLVDGLGYQINTLDIYNKWGSRVFHAENIARDEDFWDPVSTNSPTGTYFYRFIGRGQAGTIERNGVVEVLR